MFGSALTCPRDLGDSDGSPVGQNTVDVYSPDVLTRVDRRPRRKSGGTRILMPWVVRRHVRAPHPEGIEGTLMTRTGDTYPLERFISPDDPAVDL